MFRRNPWAGYEIFLLLLIVFCLVLVPVAFRAVQYCEIPLTLTAFLVVVSCNALLSLMGFFFVSLLDTRLKKVVCVIALALPLLYAACVWLGFLGWAMAIHSIH